MDTDFRKRIAGKFPPILAIDQLAETIEERTLAGFDAGLEQGITQPERGELAHGMRQERDANAELPDLGCAFIDAAGNAAFF